MGISATVSLAPQRESASPCSFSTPSARVAHFTERCPPWLTSLQSTFSITKHEERQMLRMRQDLEVSSFCSSGIGLYGLYVVLGKFCPVALHGPLPSSWRVAFLRELCLSSVGKWDTPRQDSCGSIPGERNRET